MEHLSTVIVIAAIGAAFFAVILRGILRKKAGKSGCGCSCSGCASKGLCHPERD